MTIEPEPVVVLPESATPIPGTRTPTLEDLTKAAATRRPVSCAVFETAVNARLAALDDGTHNILGPCGEGKAGCGCGGSGATKKVDLIILLDSSGSMKHPAEVIPAAAKEAIAMAARECPSDLRVAWLVVDGAKPGANPPGDLGDISPTLAGTPFTQSHQQYLQGIGVTGPFEQGRNPIPTRAGVARKGRTRSPISAASTIGAPAPAARSSTSATPCSTASTTIMPRPRPMPGRRWPMPARLLWPTVSWCSRTRSCRRESDAALGRGL
jgi:hypothetical protein